MISARLAVHSRIYLLALALILLLPTLAPISKVHATSGCITSCLLRADTTVSASDGTIFVELDNNTGLVYALPHLFSFANNSIHTLAILNSTFTASSGSGARYVWSEWTHSNLQWAPTPMMRTPNMLFNYTGASDGGSFIAQFDKQFQYTLTFKDAAGNPLSPNPSSVVISSTGATITTSMYSNQWLTSTSWTVTSATWEGYQTALSSPVSLDLTSSSVSASVSILAYSASVKVVDKSSNPIQGASLTIIFANATTRTFTTNSLGVVQLGDVPYGSYTASASYQGQVQGPVGEDATANTVATIQINWSPPPPPPPATPPSWPTGSTLTVRVLDSASVVVTWPAANSSATILHYRVLQNGNLIATLPGNATFYAVTGLSPGGSYFFQIQAVDSSGNVSSNQLSATATTPTPGPTLTIWYLVSAVVAAVGGLGALGFLLWRNKKRHNL